MKEVGRVLYGSQNLALDGPDSDKDYKVLMTPSFDDLYYNKDCSHHMNEHESAMDVRKWCDLVLRGNVNCVEMLFSCEWHFQSAELAHFVNYIRNLYNEGYLATVWTGFFNSLKGLVFNSLKRYGENPKTVSRAWALEQLAMCVVADNFCLSELTYRGNSWNKSARSMRFDPNYNYMPDHEHFEKSLENLGTAAAPLALSMGLARQEEYDKKFLTAVDIMKDLVYIEMGGR